MTGTAGHGITKVFFALMLCVFCSAFLHAQSGGGRTEDMVFKVAVYGPSDEIFIWWGHAALIVEHTRWGYSRVYDWGIFSYPSDNFLADFIKNNVKYKCIEGALDMEEYIKEDRDITVYTLDLDTERKEAMLSYAENKVLPENCYYDYHEFRDNCATGVRDILDIGTKGELRARLGGVPGRQTIRQHVRRFTSLRPLADWCFDFLMGRDLDRPVSAWDEMFLPVEIGRHITAFRYTDDSGAERPLVKSVQIVNASKNRQPVLGEALEVWPLHLLFGVMLAVVMVCAKRLRGTFFWDAGRSIFALFFGIAGAVLFFGLFFLQNDYIQQNINILYITPLLLAVPPLVITGAVREKSRAAAEKWLRVIWGCVSAAGILTVLAGLLPGFYQHNQSAQFLFLPSALVFADFEKWTFLWKKK